jgi:hypothetical protein
MSPDQMNWQHQTLLHHRGHARDHRVRGHPARRRRIDDSQRRRVSVHAACLGRREPIEPRLVEFLLSRGAPVNHPDDEPWATPLAWAERRGHQQIAAMLRAHGATR